MNGVVQDSDQHKAGDCLRCEAFGKDDNEIGLGPRGP